MTTQNNSPEDDTPFTPPSINHPLLLSGASYVHYSPIPATTQSTPCVLGVDEAGRGPVLGPMIYGTFFLPLDLHHSLLFNDNAFTDSKALTPAVRTNLMHRLCTPGTDLFESCGWAVKILSARDISSNMMPPTNGAGGGGYNLNAQAFDATVQLIRGVVEERKVDVREVYIDTVGNSATYQQKLERVFPSLKITVAKKADSLFPCVSAASVAAKVTRDVALDACYEEVVRARRGDGDGDGEEAWGSGYPSDSKCVAWLRRNMDPVFGWGNECRFSWGTAKEILESKGGIRVDWPEEDQGSQLKDFFLSQGKSEDHDELREWYGRKATEVM